MSYELEQPKLRATFFVLGWLAERLPHLVREIRNRGHEIASHGFEHCLCGECSEDDLTKDLGRSKKLLEDIIAGGVYGYRAPSFSIDEHILSLIKDAGYTYDSSYHSFSRHGRYGRLNLSGNGRHLIKVSAENTFYELPVSNLTLAGRVLPWAGGGYFRLVPFTVFKRGIQAILEKDGVYVFYMHPWEIDPEQPRVEEAPASFKFRHYVNLNKTFTKLQKLLKAFGHCRFITCSDYLKEVAS